MFDRQAFEAACTAVGVEYEKTAPTVDAWQDVLYAAKDDAVTLSDLVLLGRLADERPPANYAANLVYHHMQRRGISTVGHAGF